jgi:hypothetical protein
MAMPARGRRGGVCHTPLPEALYFQIFLEIKGSALLDPAKFDEFRRGYVAELAAPPQSQALERPRARGPDGPLTLLTAIRGLGLSQAVLAELPQDGA